MVANQVKTPGLIQSLIPILFFLSLTGKSGKGKGGGGKGGGGKEKVPPRDWTPELEAERESIERQINGG